MTHSKLRARLNEYVDRTLPGKLRSEVSAHLASCESCAVEVRELEATVALLRRMPEVEPPPHFASAVMARVRDGEAEPRSLRRSLQQLLQPTITVTATAAVAGLAVFAVTRELAAPLPLAERADGQVVAVQPLATTPVAPTALAPEAPATRSLAPAAPPAPVRMAASPRDGRVGQALGRQMLRRHRALLRRGHSDEVARTLRGAGHPHSAALAAYFEDRSEGEVLQLTVASQAKARRR